MQSDNLIKIIVGGALGVLLLVTLALPVIASATETHTTFTNEGAFYVEADPSDTYTIEYDKATEAGVVYINDIALGVEFSTGYTILALDKSILRLQSGDNTMQYKGNGSYITGIQGVDLTISNGAVNGTFVNLYGETQTWPTTTYTEIYIASPTEQDYVMTEYNTTTKMLGDSEIFAFGQTTIGTTPCLFKITGNIDDGATVACLDRTSGEPVEGAVISNLAINKTAVDGYLDLYDLTSITFTVTLADTSTANCTYSAYIIPAEVTAEKAVHFSDAEITMLELVPLLLAVALVLGVIAYAVRARLS